VTSLNPLNIWLSSSCEKVSMNAGFLSQLSQPRTLSKSAELNLTRLEYTDSRSAGSSFLRSAKTFARSSVHDKIYVAPLFEAAA